jgi:hypothetical protein
VGIDQEVAAFSFSNLALAASQSAWVIWSQPCPAQLFWPAQELWEVAQAEVPLQLLTPSHFTLPSSATAVLMAPAAKSTAAEAASAIWETLVLMNTLPRWLG